MAESTIPRTIDQLPRFVADRGYEAADSTFRAVYASHERIDMREAMMGEDDDSNSLDRRIFLGASTATLLGPPGISLAQQQGPSGPRPCGKNAGRLRSELRRGGVPSA